MIRCPGCGKNCMPSAGRCKWCGLDFSEEHHRAEVRPQQDAIEAATGMTWVTKTFVSAGAALVVLGVAAMVIFWLAEYRKSVALGAILVAAGIASIMGAVWIQGKRST